MLPLSSGWNIEAALSFGTLIFYRKTTGCQNVEGHDLNFHRCGNLNSGTIHDIPSRTESVERLNQNSL
jgi:hypothetical protein